MFELQGVKYKEIIDIPSLTIGQGRVTTLMGQSGSGKTTILKLLNKMISPDEGRILYLGEDLAQISSVAHRRRVTMLSQSPAIFEGTVRDNLVVGLGFQGRPRPKDAELAAMLKKVRLDKPLSEDTRSLSGGEKQRLALGRVLLLNSDVYLLDEPSSALDADTAEAVIRMIVDFSRGEGRTLVMVTHAQAIAERFSDDIVTVKPFNAAGGQV
jgi:putative ABC transport system ATP-binding protein